MGEIVFLQEDTAQQTAVKTVHLWAGTDNLRKELTKLGVSYTKVNKGVFVTYVLRSNKFDKTIVKL